MGSKKDKTTFGTLANALFWMVILSGILLAIPYDVSAPYLSISSMMVGNPWASLIRNFHYWSSQFFLIFSLIHLYDHFHKKEKIGLKSGMAFRLSLAVLIIFFAMITGFLLKGDADSEQAKQIIQSLTNDLPLIGKTLSFSLLGTSDSHLLIYVHHIATFTIFIAIVMVEHSRRFWPPILDFTLTFIGVLTISYFFGAPLHDNFNPSIKGPWYFVGFQEILHWLNRPGWLLVLFFLLFVLIYLANTAKTIIMLVSKRVLLGFVGVYIVLTFLGLFFRGANWQWITPTSKDYNYSVLHNFKTSKVNFSPEFEPKEISELSVIQGRRESCMACHIETQGFTKAHNPGAIGCFSCHGGDPFSTGKSQAHKNMNLIPGNLATANQSCGTARCHPGIVARVPTGLMSTLNGMISVDRYVFGEQDNPDVKTNVHQLDNTAADIHLKNLCVRCHLGNPKTEYGPITEQSRGGGCLACHLNYSREAETAISQKKETLIKSHPEISLKVTNNHCFGCHSRSGRISTNYEGWHETNMEASQMPGTNQYRLVEGNRVFIKKQADVHYKLGMDCIDCHNSYELMGDGNYYKHKENQLEISCADCHVSGMPNTTTAANLDGESAMIAALRYGNISDSRFLVTAKNNRALINTFVVDDTVLLITKNGKKKMAIKSPSRECARNTVHSAVACSSCHTAWAPTCIGCHNSFDAAEPGYDMIANKKVQGSWVEYTGEYHAILPTLGVRIIEKHREIIPVTPGMVLTIDKKSFNKEAKDSLIFHRLFAPIAPHTTSPTGRSCKSCHNDPVAMGFGEGQLTYDISGERGIWTFEPYYDNDIHDGLPADAWIGFMQNRKGHVSTRQNVYPLDIVSQKKILTVGACLTCHGENSKVMQESLYNYSTLLKNRRKDCKLPIWED